MAAMVRGSRAWNLAGGMGISRGSCLPVLAEMPSPLEASTDAPSALAFGSTESCADEGSRSMDAALCWVRSTSAEMPPRPAKLVEDGRVVKAISRGIPSPDSKGQRLPNRLHVATKLAEYDTPGNSEGIMTLLRWASEEQPPRTSKRVTSSRACPLNTLTVYVTGSCAKLGSLAASFASGPKASHDNTALVSSAWMRMLASSLAHGGDTANLIGREAVDQGPNR
mmetsp:Transcript_41234/g.118156  ORF Transcript_41234/g.118156 Transcript_41234/m.118156 type:complete len:224 (+) Transcript_41234:140-811(+)